MMIFLINLVKGYDVIKRIYYIRQRMIKECYRWYNSVKKCCYCRWKSMNCWID